MKYLVTGAAGFIGSFVAKRLCNEGHEVVGFDNLNDYYDSVIKLAHLDRIKHLDYFHLMVMDIFGHRGNVSLLKSEHSYRAMNLATQTEARCYIEKPLIYMVASVMGFVTMLETISRKK